MSKLVVPFEKQDVTSIGYRLSNEPEESLFSHPIPMSNRIYAKMIKARVPHVCRGQIRHITKIFVLSDTLSIKKPALRTRISTKMHNFPRGYKASLINDLVSESYIVKMSPQKKRTLRISINKRNKPGPFI